MNKTQDIRYKIGQLGAADFEVFCCHLLGALDDGRLYGTIDGGVNADGETTKGTPDAVARRPNGKYVAFQFTAQKDKQHQKLIGDIRKIADPAKCPVSRDVEAVVVCLNNTLRHPRIEYEREAQGFGWSLTIYTLDELTAFAQKHGEVSERFLSFVSTASNHSPSVGVTPGNSVPPEQTFRCGARARRDAGLGQSEFIELTGFPSHSDFDRIERGRLDCPASLIASVSDATGVQANWIKHGKGTPYAARESAFGLIDIEADMAVIAAQAPERMYLCLDPWFYNVCLVIKSPPQRWTVFIGLFTMNVHQWVDGHREIPNVYNFLHQLFERFTYGKESVRTESHVLPPVSYWRLTHGGVCPDKLLNRPVGIYSDGQQNHWADDIRDIYHRFAIAPTYEGRYGRWFIEAQSCFRNYVSHDEAVRPWRLQAGEI